MKECPVCKAGSFDDAEICYGCLHRFDPGQGMQTASRRPSPGTPPGSNRVADAEKAAPDVMEVPAMAVARPADSMMPPASSAAERTSVSSAGVGGLDSSGLSVGGSAAPSSSPAMLSGRLDDSRTPVDIGVPLDELQSFSGQSVSLPAPGGEIVLRIELHDVRSASERSESQDRARSTMRVRTCERLHQGVSRGARVEVRYPSERESPSGPSGDEAHGRESRSRHASSPRHAQVERRDMCAVGA